MTIEKKGYLASKIKIDFKSEGIESLHIENILPEEIALEIIDMVNNWKKYWVATTETVELFQKSAKELNDNKS